MADTALTFSLQPAPRSLYLPRRSLYARLEPQFLKMLPKGKNPNGLTLILNGTCVHESHRAVAKQQKSDRHRSTPTFHLGGVQREQEQTPASSFSLEGPELHTFQLLPEDPASKQPASRCWPWCFPLGH